MLVPVTIDDFAIDGLRELVEQIDNTREDLNPGLRFCGCFVTQYDRTNEADTQGEEFLKIPSNSIDCFKSCTSSTE